MLPAAHRRKSTGQRDVCATRPVLYFAFRSSPARIDEVRFSSAGQRAGYLSSRPNFKPGLSLYGCPTLKILEGGRLACHFSEPSCHRSIYRARLLSFTPSDHSDDARSSDALFKNHESHASKSSKLLRGSELQFRHNQPRTAPSTRGAFPASSQPRLPLPSPSFHRFFSVLPISLF
jgi:hypothetical protein